jgi:hypothetical protein
MLYAPLTSPMRTTCPAHLILGIKWKMYVNYAVRLIILKLGMGKIDSSLIDYILFENFRLKTAVNRLQFIS